MSKLINVLIYCDVLAVADLTPEQQEALPDVIRRKGVLPALRDVLTDEPIQLIAYYQVATQGSKSMWHAIVRLDDEAIRIANYITELPELGILYWADEHVEEVYRKLWIDNQVIAKRVLNYPVEITENIDGEDVTYIKIVTAYEAENDYSEILDTDLLMVPHRFLLRD